MSKVHISTVLSVIVAGFLCISGLEHLRNPFLFLKAVVGYEVFSFEVSTGVAIIVPVLQIGIAILLIPLPTRRIAAVFAALLFQGYVLAQCIALVRGLDISCGCFGSLADDKVTLITVARSGMLGAFAVLVAMLPSYRQNTRYCLTGEVC